MIVIFRPLALCLGFLLGGARAFAPPSTSFRRTTVATSPRQQAWSSLSSSLLPPHSSSRRWCSSSASSGGEGEADGFSYADLHRELNRRRVEQEMSQQQPSPVMQDGEAFMEEQMTLRKKLPKAYVLVYNQGQAEEGVYTLFVEGRNVLRAWEDKPEAARYALMLRAEDLPLGKPTELPMSHIIGFCKDNGVGLEVVPRGRGLQPPSRNKPEFDFDCSTGPDVHPTASSSATTTASPAEESLFTPQELARIKRQFEKSLEGGEEET